ncbi:hypothetical protein D3C87_2134400 [compost metagenome]
MLTLRIRAIASADRMDRVGLGLSAPLVLGIACAGERVELQWGKTPGFRRRRLHDCLSQPALKDGLGITKLET